MNSEMIFVDNAGKEVKCNLVARWTMDANNYIAYTDGTKTDNELNLFVSKYDEVNGEIKLSEIESDAEWKKVNDFLDKYMYEDGEV